MALIAKAIREAGDAEALAVFGLDVNCEPLEGDTGDPLERVQEVADRAGKPHDAFYLASFVWSGFDNKHGRRCLEGF